MVQLFGRMHVFVLRLTGKADSRLCSSTAHMPLYHLTWTAHMLYVTPFAIMFTAWHAREVCAEKSFSLSYKVPCNLPGISHSQTLTGEALMVVSSYQLKKQTVLGQHNWVYINPI